MRTLVLLTFLCGFCLSFPSTRLSLKKRKYRRGVENVTENASVFKTIYEINRSQASFDPRHIITHTDIAVSIKRSAKVCRYGVCLWPKSDDGNVYVPYTQTNDFHPMHREILRSALDELEGSTCIRFTLQTTEKDYIRFDNLKGCWSSLGCTGGPQTLSLQIPGCVWSGVIIHEVIHALGIHHEHVRRDRDQYVSVQWDNIIAGSKLNFEEADTYNLEMTKYDYGSIMHYTRNAFSIDGILPTMISVPKDDVFFGQQFSMSELDILKINSLYKCSQLMNNQKAAAPPAETTAGTTTTTTPTTTTTTTPPTTTTTTTTKATTTKSRMTVSNGCGGNFTTTPGIITSPNYPQNYPSNKRCVWNITIPSPFSVTFTDFDVEEIATCNFDSVMIYNGPTRDKKYLSGVYCGTKPPPPIFSHTETVLIVLTTDETVQNKGFQLVYDKV